MTGPLTRRLTGLAGAGGLIAIIVGLPALLLAIGAAPIPSAIPTWAELRTSLLAPDDGSLLMGLLAVVAWMAWAFMTVTLITELVAQIRGVRAPHLPGLGRPQAVARGLVAMAALLFASAPVSVPTWVPPADAASTVEITAVPAASNVLEGSTIDGTIGPDQQPKEPAAAGVKAQRETVSHTVRPGESLWVIAEQYLGDGNRYREIVELNLDLVGSRPSFLEPGWVLRVPVAHDDSTSGRPYVVAPGDTLSAIAEAELGDSRRYPAIFRASTGVVQPGGVHISDPDVIDVGWTLVVPQDGSRPPAQGGHPALQQPRVPAEAPEAPITMPPSGHSATPEEAPPATEGAVADPVAGADRTPDVDDTTLDAPWVMAGLAGGGALLSGALLLTLRTRRRFQLRNRRPGRVIATPPSFLAPVEKTLTAAGGAAAATVEFADEALRRLAAAVGLGSGVMPPLAAVELGRARLTLHLSAALELPAPWVGSPDHTHWHVPTDLEIGDLGPDVGVGEAPYPLLLTVGTTDTGQTWLLNFEELPTVILDGEEKKCRDFARHLAAQVAVNPWCRRVRLDCVGVAEEVVGMDDRLVYHSPAEAAGSVAQEVLADAVAMIDRANRRGVDVSSGRTGRADDDVWPSRMLMLDSPSGVPAELGQLLGLVHDHVGKSATSLVIVGELPGAPGAVLRMSSTGRLILERVGLELSPVSLTSEEARGCALLYAQSDIDEDVPAPADDSPGHDWSAYVDRSGALRSELVSSRTVRGLDEPGSSLLEGADEDYVRAGTILAEELEALAPTVPAQVRVEIEGKDPTLDEDVAAWFSADCDRPRLTLLGPVMARTRGKALAKRKPYFTELLTYLALRRRHGVTGESICEAFGIQLGKARDYINIVRDWLGSNPVTGEPHLPYADRAPAAQRNGRSVYQVDTDLLIDLDLFLRLRTRGQARGGASGLADLRTALELVTGPPFSNLRETGWSWLADGERFDLMAPGWVADVALIVVTDALARGDVAQAREAAAIATMADLDGESTRLCMAHVTAVEGDRLEAERIVREDVCNRSDDGEAPTDLSARTKAILRNQGWLAS